MIDRGKLLSDLQSLLRKLEADLLERSELSDVPEVGQTLRDEYQKARQANRTAQSYDEWRSDYITQIAAAWVLSCVFARFLEDNRLVDPPRLAGPGDRLTRARDEHELYFRAYPTQTDRDYLLHVFGELRKLPGAKEIFGEHNAIHELPNWLSGDAAGELLRFFQRIDANTGTLIHDFTDPNWDTRFLGDLYQDLSETARKKYALLQTPMFVEEFILDRTLDPAIEEFGLEGFRMIDPASGSGHFLLGSFHRILQRWLTKEPGMNVRALVQRALDSIHGVDVNPYAVAISRFRLLLVALRESGISRLQDAPDFHFNLAAGDSLLHGVPGREQEVMGFHELAHHYQSEDLALLRRILRPGTYNVVVANPPYIIVRDRALNRAYRERYSTCHQKFSLVVPFTERIFNLSLRESDSQPRSGFVGMIAANSFMRREFGKKLIEEYYPKIELTHVIDTAGAYIPGHGTPTAILFARNRRPISSMIRAALGVQGEPETPSNPAMGKVWRSIVENLDSAEFENEFITITDVQRSTLSIHPWSLGGGGASDLKEQIEDSATIRLTDLVLNIGVNTAPGEDDVYVFADPLAAKRLGVAHIRPMVFGDMIRDWNVIDLAVGVWPYSLELRLLPLNEMPDVFRILWPAKQILKMRRRFGVPMLQKGAVWYEWQELYRDKIETPQAIIFAEVATHNHFAYVNGPQIYKNSVQVIKLPHTADRDAHLAILGVLNSALACFWMKQVCHNKGSTVDQNNARQRTAAFEDFFAFNATRLRMFPIPDNRPLRLTRDLYELAQKFSKKQPSSLLLDGDLIARAVDLRQASSDWAQLLHQMIATQEELDWECYRLYGLIDENLTYSKDLPPVQFGQRSFEIVLARKVATGDLETTWFDRHGSTPITEILPDWPDDYKKLIERRMELIESDRNIGLIEQPEYKRRWNTEPWQIQLQQTLRKWLLDRLEGYFDFDGRLNGAGNPSARLEIKPLSIIKLVDFARRDSEFMRIGELFRDDSAFDVQKLIEELVTTESVPLLPILRYKDSGLRKRGEWEQTWNLQRQEDAIDTRTKLPKENPNYISDIDAEDFGSSGMRVAKS